MATPKKGAASPKLPANLSLDADQQKKFNRDIKNVKTKDVEGTGVIYVGHIPYGFFEPQMRKYFTQFGKVLNLRLSRSKKSGRSKGYAFVEFQSHGIAQIVADTMDNYLMFHRLLKCKLMDTEKIHPDLFKNARQMFRKPKQHLMTKQRHNTLQSDQCLNKSVAKMRSKKKKTLKKLAEIGIEYELPESYTAVKKIQDDSENDTVPSKRRKLSNTPKSKRSKTESEVTVPEKISPAKKAARTPLKTQSPPQSLQTPGNKTPGNKTPGNKTPGNKTPGNKTPGNKTPGNKTHGNKTPGNKTPGNKTPGNKTPGNKTPGNKTPGNKTPGNKTPDNKTPGNKTPGNKTPGNKTPGNKTPGNKIPGNKTPDSKTPGNKTPGNKTTGNKTPGNKTPGNKTPSKKLPATPGSKVKTPGAARSSARKKTPKK